jgi:hypothetical protein
MFFDRMPDESKRDIDDRIDELETVFRSKQASGGIPSDQDLLNELEQWYQTYC